MPYESKNFDKLYGTAGFSQKLLENHFTLYKGYVTNTNKLADLLAALAKEGKSQTPEYAETKRRFGWEFDGMRLHEYYFGNMAKGGVPADQNARLLRKLAADFGSFDAWRKDFTDTGSIRGIGWTLLVHDPQGDRLFNIWVNEHDAGHLVGLTPLLVMDVFEHAFVLDYGVKRADYLSAFLQAVDWGVVCSRFEQR